MLTTTLAVLVATQVADIKPAGDAPTIKWGKDPAYVVTSEGAGFKIAGPTKVMVNVAGAKELRNSTINLEIVRNDTHVSKNEIKLKNKRGGPKGYPAQGGIGIEVPEGEQTYTLNANTELVVSLVTTKRIAKRARAAAEIALEVASAPPPEPEPDPQPEPTEPVEEIAAVAADDGSVEVEETGSITNLVQAKRVAVYDLELSEIEPTIGAVVTDSLVTEIRKLQGISVIGMDEIRDMLSHEANKQFLGCESDESCLAEIAGALGVDDLVTGKLSKVADNHMMLVRRIDQKRAQVAGVYDQRLAAESGQEFLLSVGPAVEQLFPETPLRDGMERGVAEEVALRLDPPPLPPWSFYTVAGAAVAAAAAGGVFGLLANSAEGEFNTLAGTEGRIEGAELVDLENKANSRALGANVAFGVAGGLAVSAAVMFLFTDWHGYGDVQVSQ